MASTPLSTRGQNRQPAPRMELFKIPVNVPPDVHEFRADISSHARWLPPHLANVLTGCAVIADAGGDHAVTTYEAISAATHTPGIRRRYKCKPVSPRQVERNLPELRELGLVTWYSAKTQVTHRGDDYGQVRSRVYLRFAIEDIERLYRQTEKLRAEKAVKDADRNERRAASKQAYEEKRKAERARNAVLTCDNEQGINPSRHANGGSSGGTDGGRIVPSQSFVTDRPTGWCQSGADDTAEAEEPQTQNPDDGIGGVSQDHARVINEKLRDFHGGKPIPGGEFDARFLPQEVSDRLNSHQIDVADVLDGMFSCIPGIMDERFASIPFRERLAFAPHRLDRIQTPARFILSALKGDVQELEKYQARARQIDEADQQQGAILQELEAARQEAARVAAEIESFREKFRAIEDGGFYEGRFKFHVKEWRDKGVPDEKILARLSRVLKFYEDQAARRNS